MDNEASTRQKSSLFDRHRDIMIEYFFWYVLLIVVIEVTAWVLRLQWNYSEQVVILKLKKYLQN